MSRGDSLAPVYLTRWALVGAIVLWCIGCIAMVFTDTVRWQLRGQVLVNITVMAAAAGILVVFMRSAAARGAAGRLARELDTTPLSAGRLARSVRSALRDPNARLLFRDAAGTAWVDSDGRAVLPTEARSITTFGALGAAALEHDPCSTMILWWSRPALRGPTTARPARRADHGRARGARACRRGSH